MHLMGFGFNITLIICGVQAQLLPLQQSVASVMSAMAANPSAQATLLPQLMALQQQQTALVMGLVSAPAPAAPAAPAPAAAAAPPAVAWGVPQQQQAQAQPWMQQQQQQQQQQPAVGGFSFLASPPQPAAGAQQPLSSAGTLGSGFALNGRAAPAAAALLASPAPVAAPKVHDPFDFASKDLFSSQ